MINSLIAKIWLINSALGTNERARDIPIFPHATRELHAKIFDRSQKALIKMDRWAEERQRDGERGGEERVIEMGSAGSKRRQSATLFGPRPRRK